MCASILRLRHNTQNIVHPVTATSYLPGNCKAWAIGLRLLQESMDNRPYTWREIMKALIAALALVTLVASPTFAQTAGNNAANCYGQGFGPSSPCYP
jgi:hypothetical protein